MHHIKAVTGSQLKLGLEEKTEPDRNYRYGGKSFYFFDLDDNILHLDTKIYLFHKHTGREIALSSQEWAKAIPLIGKEEPYRDYQVIDDPQTGSFRRFRDFPHSQPFLEDLEQALQKTEIEWRGPSWDFFYYAVLNQRPLSIITARGHNPDTIRDGFIRMVDLKILPQLPNTIGIYTVSNLDVRTQLGDTDRKLSTAELKKRALIQIVERAFQFYGVNPYHRFGMSDDDPANIESAVAAMRELKRRYPKNSFFVISAEQNPVIKREVFDDRVHAETYETLTQQGLFEFAELASKD